MHLPAFLRYKRRMQEMQHAVCMHIYDRNGDSKVIFLHRGTRQTPPGASQGLPEHQNKYFGCIFTVYSMLRQAFVCIFTVYSMLRKAFVCIFTVYSMLRQASCMHIYGIFMIKEHNVYFIRIFTLHYTTNVFSKFL